MEKEARSSFKEKEKKDEGEIVSCPGITQTKMNGSNKKTGSKRFVPFHLSLSCDRSTLNAEHDNHDA